MSKEHPINIQCPFCFKENDIKLEHEIECEYCNKKLTGHSYIKPVLSGFSIFLIASMIGAGSTYGIKEHIEKNRYPVTTEYSIIKLCLSGNKRPLKSKQYNNKEQICLNSLVQTQKKYDFEDFKKNPTEFLLEFERNANYMK